MIVYKAIYINGLGVLSSSFYFIVLWCVSSGFAFIVYFDTFILHIFGNTNVLCVFCSSVLYVYGCAGVVRRSVLLYECCYNLYKFSVYLFLFTNVLTM